MFFNRMDQPKSASHLIEDDRSHVHLQQQQQQQGQVILVDSDSSPEHRQQQQGHVRLQKQRHSSAQDNIQRRVISDLARIKSDLNEDVRQQLRNVSIYNFCALNHFPDEASCIHFCQGFGLCPDRLTKYQHCRGDFCHVSSDHTRKLGFKFRCLNKTKRSKNKCLSTISPLINTFFEGSNLRFHDILKIVFGFVSQLPVKHVVEQLGITAVTIIDWFVFCREVCEVVLANEFREKIGGEGMTVEVDESHLFRRKYGVGRRGKWEDQWLLGCYCRETKQCRIVLVKDRKRATIMPLLLKFIDKRSRIVTDFAQIYKGCQKFGFYKHDAVCHKRYFVCPTNKDVYTNNIEVTWRWRKRSVLSCGDENSVDRYLAESEYRNRYFKNMHGTSLPLDDKLLIFLHHIKLVYPGPGIVGMTFPASEEEIDNLERNAGDVIANVADDVDDMDDAVLLQDDAEDALDIPSKKKKMKNNLPTGSNSCVLSDDIEFNSSHKPLSQNAKKLIRSFICKGSSFTTPSQTRQIFHLNESILHDMLLLLRSSIPQTCGESDTLVNKSLLNELHPAFRRFFTVIKTPAFGDCFFQAVSLALFGSTECMELIRLCSALMIIRYHDVFRRVFYEVYMNEDFDVRDPMHFLTVGTATPSTLVERCLELNEGRRWEQYSDSFCWATNVSVLAFSLACQRPLYIYNSFRLDSAWRFPADMSVTELNNRSDIGGSVNLGHASFANAEPIRLYLEDDHYSAIVPVVNSLPAQFKPSILNTIPIFNLCPQDQISSP